MFCWTCSNIFASSQCSRLPNFKVTEIKNFIGFKESARCIETVKSGIIIVTMQGKDAIIEKTWKPSRNKLL